MNSSKKCAITKAPRTGCKDIWNAYMANGAIFGKYDIPYCPTTASKLPHDIITWEEAKHVHKMNISRKNYNYRYDAFVCFYIDDHKFDGIKGIWYNSNNTLNVLKHFSGVITPDFSTYQDFPVSLKMFATYRMRLIGFWWGVNEIAVINNVRWGSEETYDYCFEGIPQNSIVAIGTVGGSPRKVIDRKRFEDGLFQMVNTLHPHTIIVYGSSNYKCFDQLKKQGINIVSFTSKTARSFERKVTI